MERLQNKTGSPPSRLDTLPPSFPPSPAFLFPAGYLSILYSGVCKQGALGLVLSGSLMSSLFFPPASNDTLAFMEGTRVSGAFQLQLRICVPGPHVLDWNGKSLDMGYKVHHRGSLEPRRGSLEFSLSSPTGGQEAPRARYLPLTLS